MLMQNPYEVAVLDQDYQFLGADAQKRERVTKYNHILKTYTAFVTRVNPEIFLTNKNTK